MSPEPKPRQGKTPAARSLPKCKAFLICDDVTVDALTGRPSLFGLFNTCSLAQLPGATQPFVAFLQLIDAVGRFLIHLEIHDLSTGDLLGTIHTPSVQLADRLITTNVVIRIPAIPVANAGIFDLVAFADNQEIDRQHFRVALVHPDESNFPSEPS